MAADPAPSASSPRLGSGSGPVLKAGAFTALVVAGAVIGASGLGLGALGTGLMVGALGGLTAALAFRLCAGRLHDDAGYVAGALENLRRSTDEDFAPPAGSLRQAFESAAERVSRLAEQESFMRAVADSAHGAEALFDLAGRLVWVNPSVYRLTGYTPEECRAAPDLLELLVHPSDRAHAHAQARLAGQGGQGQDQELRLMHRVKGGVTVLCHWHPFVNGGVGQEGVRLSVEDITARKETEYRFLESVAELRRAQALSEHYLARSADERSRMAALFDVIRLGILFMDRDNRVQYFNRALLRIWGFPDEENLLGVRDLVLQGRVAPLLAEPEAYLAHVQKVREDRVSEPFEIALKDGRVLTDLSTVVGGADGQGAIGRVWIYEDVTEARRISRQLVEMAERDPLTNLYNRRRFHEELERVLADAARRGAEVGLVVLDLDGFKPINDRYGHQAGDEVLVTLARELGRVVRRNEMFFRLGGDEFAILAADADEAALGELARRVVERTAALRFSFGGAEEVGVTASLGLALYPRHARDGEHLMAVADAAMYRAKVTGRNRWAMADGAAMMGGAGG